MKSLMQREKELNEDKQAKTRKEEECKQREAAAIRELSENINAYTGTKGLVVEQVVKSGTLQFSTQFSRGSAAMSADSWVAL